MLGKIKLWAGQLKLELTAIYIASKDNRTPRMAKLLAIAVVAYALSPIDLIPDFIPVLGLLDDLIIVRLIPHDLMTNFRQNAKTLTKPSSNWTAAMLIITLWVAFAVVFVCTTLKRI